MKFTIKLLRYEITFFSNLSILPTDLHAPKLAKLSHWCLKPSLAQLSHLTSE